MKATIDAAGRIVVPKPLRLALGLKAGQPLEIVAGDGRLEIEIAATPMKLQKRGKGASEIFRTHWQPELARLAPWLTDKVSFLHQ